MPYPRRTATVTLQPDWAVGMGSLVGGGATSSGGQGASIVPTITSISPSSGVTAGGVAFTLGGTNFVISSTTVSIGGTNASGVSVISGTTLVGVSPAGTEGTGDVVVTTPNGSATSEDAFTFLNNFAITGSLNAGSSAISGGRVILYDSSGNSYKTAVVNASGAYAFSNVTGSGASYYLYPHPAYTHSLASSESGWNDSNVTGQISVTVNSSDVSRNIALRESHLSDDFQTYANTAALKNATSGFGGTATGGTNNVIEPSFASVNLTTDGPGGSKVMRYDVTYGGASNCTGGTITIETIRNWTPPGGTFYVRIMDYLSSNFVNADYSCAETAEYKYLMVWAQKDTGGLDGAIHFEMQNGPSTFRMYANFDDGVGAHYVNSATNFNGCYFPGPNPCNYDVAAAEWRGRWNTYVIEVHGFATSSQTVNLYKNGALVQGLNMNHTGLTGLLHKVAWGANFNSIPQVTGAYRLFRECGIYFTRPALIDVVS